MKTNHFAKKVEYLENPEKRGGILPEKLLNILPIKKKGHFLDVGAGTGYYTIPAAKFVEGDVFALDIDPKMLKIINSKAEQEVLTNIKTLKGSLDHIPLPDHSIDFVFASLVLHEVKQLSHSLQQMKQVLKPDGYLACIEFEKKDTSSDKHPRISSAMMEQEITNAGLKVTEKINLPNDLYTIIATK